MSLEENKKRRINLLSEELAELRVGGWIRTDDLVVVVRKHFMLKAVASWDCLYTPRNRDPRTPTKCQRELLERGNNEISPLVPCFLFGTARD